MDKAFCTVALIAVLTILFIIFHAAHVVERSPDIEWNKPHPGFNRTMNLMVLSLGIVFAYLIFVLIKILKISTPHAAFVFLASYIWGCISYYDDVLLLCTDIMHVCPRELAYVYVSIVMFQVGFLVDVSIFLKTLPQIIVISVPVALATGSIFGALTKVMVAPTWPDIVAIMFGIMATPTYSKTVALILQQETLRTKQLNILLEGEALFTFALADVVHELVSCSMAGIAREWYQFILLTLRFIVVGGVSGYVLGCLTAIAMHRMSDDKLSLHIVVSVVPFFIFSLSNVYLSGCGSISVMVAGLVLAKERLSLDRQVEQFLSDVCNFTGFIVNVALGLVSGLYCAVHVVPNLHWNVFFLALLLLTTFYAVRFLCYLLFLPIISRLGYGMDFKSMLICVLGGLRSSYCIQIVLIFARESLTGQTSHEFYFYMVSLYFLSNFINGSFLRNMLELMDISRVSLSRQVNMDNCMRHVLRKRDRIVAILKMDRFLSDADWALVHECTNIQHPYYTEIHLEDEDSLLFTGKKFTYCPDCQKNVAQELNAKELKELMREAKMRILKAKKMSYARKFSMGMMSKDCIRILGQAVELAMDSEEATIEVEDLHRRFTQENWLSRFIRERCEKWKIRQQKFFKKYKPPTTYWRRVCYHLVVTSRTRLFDKIMLGIIVLHLIVIFFFMSYHPTLWKANQNHFHHEDIHIHQLLVGAKFLFVAIYIIEFIIRVLAYSYKRIWGGLRLYFTSIVRIIDFIVILVCLANSILLIVREAFHNDLIVFSLYLISDGLSLLTAVRALLFIQIFYPSIIEYLDKKTDKHLSFTYELGKTYTTGENEILDMLPHMIDNEKIRHEIKSKIESDRIVITKLLGTVQKDRPWIGITVKTIQAIRTILSSMRQAIVQLKATGWMDNFEREKLEAGMAVLFRNITQITMVEPSSPKEIFKEVAWMAGDERVIDFLFENVTIKKFEPGQIVFMEGDIADGIYIVVTGLFEINYKPDNDVLKNLKEFGQLPIVDYISGIQYGGSYTDYIVCGNCIGELSVLTERPYNCTIISEVHSQVYVLTRAVIKRAMEMSPDPVGGLECRIWKEVSIRFAVPILLSTPTYQTFSPEQIQYVLERSFMPSLVMYKIFHVTELVEDILLIEGVAADFNTREIFVAPCCIPRTVQKVILPTSSQMNISTTIKTKLLIIPAADVDEYDVMLLEAQKSGFFVPSKYRLQSFSSRSRHKRGLMFRGSRHVRRRKRFADEDALSAATSYSSPSEGSSRSGSLFYRNLEYADTTSVVLIPFDEDESLYSDAQKIGSSSSGMMRQYGKDEDDEEEELDEISFDEDKRNEKV